MGITQLITPYVNYDTMFLFFYHSFPKNLTLSWHFFVTIPDFGLNEPFVILDFGQAALLNLYFKVLKNNQSLLFL